MFDCCRAAPVELTAVSARENGGEGGIRTPGRVAPTMVFETIPFSHSGTSPQGTGPRDHAARQQVVNAGDRSSGIACLGSWVAISKGPLLARSGRAVLDNCGEVTEWLKELAWKASAGVKACRGFESPPLRQTCSPAVVEGIDQWVPGKGAMRTWSGRERSSHKHAVLCAWTACWSMPSRAALGEARW